MTKQIRRIFSTVAIILCVSIGLALPTEVFASTMPEKPAYSSFDDVKGEDEEIGNIVTELTDERTETSKKFLLDSGTKMIAEYDTPIHYQNDEGDWVEYNNSLKAENSTSTADEALDGEYTNISSNIDVKLSNKAKANNMIKVSSDDYSISWGYDDVNKSKIKIVNNNEKLYGNEEFTTLKNITSEAKYENVYKNVDLQYFITSTGVKENIILKSSDVQNEFNLTYKIKNLTAKQTDDYTITLYNKSNDEVYKIVAPYMTDADGNSSTQLKLELISQKGGNASVKLTVDYWFIHSIGRSFPVTVDPEVTNKLTSILSLNEGSGRISLNHGPYYTSNNNYVIATIKSLPELSDGERIVSAKYNFETTNGSMLFSSKTDTPIIINAHKLKSINNNVVSYDSIVLDYDSLTYDDNQYMSFDLTKAIKEWYDNGDNIDGFILESFDTAGSKTVSIKETSKNTTTPSFTLIYKDFKGIESNLSYHAFSVGENAQASISDYLGNIVINQSIYEGTGSRMPASITATYNSINYNKTFENGSPSGYGWQFSFNQYVREVTDINLTKVGYNYIYTDADGTDHYLKKSNSSDEWYDEDGLGLALTVNDSGIYIDNGSATQTYESVASGGKLLSEKDEYNNTITYTYTDGNVTSITDGSGRVINITYYTKSNGEKRVSKIRRPDGRNIIFSYTSSEYDKINYLSLPDNEITRLYYNSSNMLSSIEHGYFVEGVYTKGDKTSFAYDNGKVTKITEYGSDSTQGNYLNIKYNGDNTTTFTDRQGRTVTYTFDNYGNQVSVLNANGYLESSGESGLSVSSGAETFTKNYITESTEQSQIKSNGYYFKSNGDRNGTVSSGGTTVIDTSEPTEENGQVQYLGTTSIKVNNPVSSTNSAFFTGAAHQFSSTEFNGKNVTFSAYIKTKNVVQIYSGGAVGAILKIKCLNSNGAVVKEVNSIGITGSEDWQRLSVSATVPETTANIRVYCLIRYASGTAWFDCLQLEEGDTASDFNALQNGNFENNSNWLNNENKSVTVSSGTVTLNGEAGAYDNAEAVEETTVPEEEETQPATYCETVTETVPNDSITTYDNYGNVIKTEQGFVNRTVKKTYEVEPATNSKGSSASVGAAPTENNSLGNRYIYQNVNVDRAGVMFNIAGEAKADSVPLSNENRTYGIALNIYYKNNTVPEIHYQKFNSATTHKQTMSMSVTPDNPNEEIDYVSFAFVYSNNKNTMTAYNAMLNIAATNYTNDDSSSDSSENDSNTGSSGSSTDSDTESSDYCIGYEVLSESVDKSQTYMQTNTTYDSTGNYIVSETDESGSTIRYTYDILGKTTSVTDGEDNVVNYTYDSNGNLATINSNGSSNTYLYSGANNISAITHNGFNYTFNYDVFQNLVSTYIGNVVIASNTYSANNGNLTKTTYANGDYIQYTYDKYDNITKVTGETGIIAEFVYNKKGLIAKAIDYSSGRTTYYYYDFSGNLTGEYRQGADGDLSYYLSYNSDGNQVEKTVIDGQTKTVTAGTNSDGNSFVSSDGITVETETDNFGRTTQVKTSQGEGNSVYFTDYEYANGLSSNSTTNLVSKLTQKYGGNELVNYEYTYDGNNNISSVNENGDIVIEYSYDELNQLYLENDKINRIYTYYNYDNAGNIVQILKQNYNSNGVPTTTISEKNYTYDDLNWKDKLTSYNGTNITYDEMGNPLNYRNEITMTWQNGRQLASLQTSDNSVSYKYDSNGMRTQKTDNSGTTYYYYDSYKNLIGLTKNNNTLLFYYDSNGNIVSFKYGNIMYYYVKNLQGDVVKIINQSGTEIATYVYDTWGNIRSAIGDTNLKELNPFRYRSYIYDTETGLYYLQSRYYDPITGRFLNADDTAYINITSTVNNSNIFAYGNNNHINMIDTTGKLSQWIIPGVLYHWYNNNFWDIYDGYFYYGQYAPQWWAGYGFIYDSLAGMACMSLQWVKVKFAYDKKEWLFEFWKGIYGSLAQYYKLLSYYGRSTGLFYGSEIGVYNRPADWWALTWYGGHKYGLNFWRYRLGFYDCATTKDFQNMTMKLYYNGKQLFSRNATTWWLTGFKFMFGKAYAGELEMRVWIKFDSKTFRDRFVNALNFSISRGDNYYVKEVRSYYENKGYKVYFRW